MSKIKGTENWTASGASKDWRLGGEIGLISSKYTQELFETRNKAQPSITLYNSQVISLTNTF
jgi:hypothetical protein